jgi:GNAT superfamily N-acetyltransferase
MNIFIKKLLREGLLVDSELNELINKLDFSSFKINKTLNPNVWLSDTEVKPEIRQTLINIAKKYYESLGLKIPISDIILTGSLANYNWSKYSDFDIHILIDTKKFGEKEELIKDLLDTKTKSWNDSHDIKIKGYDVELYVQGVDQEHHSTGVYSLMNEKWLLKPEKLNPKINKKEVKAKYDKIVNILSDIKKEYNSEKYDLVVDRLEKLKSRIKKMRQAGLEGAGEFSSENIAFKLLRRNNIMGELYDLLISAYDKSVSIDENKTKLYEEDGDLNFEINEHEDRITITGFINEGDIVGSVILEREFDAYYEFEGEMSEDDFYEIFEDGNFIKIEYIKIEDKYKNKGYGKLLLTKAIDYVKEIGESVIYLNASPMGNTGLALPELVSFYKKFGFKIIPQLNKYKENKEMVLHLNQNINENIIKSELLEVIKISSRITENEDNTNCIDSFGNQLFGDEFGGFEKNTKLENEYAELIKKFGDSEFGEGINPKLVDSLYHLKQCVSKYPEILVPESEIVYRGSYLPLGFFIKNGLKLSEEGIDYTYTPRTPIQSWTANEKIAQQFTGVMDINFDKVGKEFIKYHVKGLKAEDKFFLDILTKKEFMGISVPVIYVTKVVKDDFLFKHNYFNILTGENEDEVIRVSREPVNVKLKINTSLVDIFTKKFIKAYNDLIEYGLDNGEQYKPKLSESKTGVIKSELVNIDDDDLYDSLEKQADELRSNSEISFGSADPFEILYDDKTGELIGATWIETSGAFSPHMVIKPKYRKMGLSKQLIDGVVEKYKKMKQIRGGNYTFMLNVVNNSLANTMEKHYGFKKVSKDSHGNITMTL